MIPSLESSSPWHTSAPNPSPAKKPTSPPLEMIPSVESSSPWHTSAPNPSPAKKPKRNRMEELSDSELAARFLTREDLKLSFAEKFEKILVASDLADAERAAKRDPRDGKDPLYDPDKPLPEGFAWVSAFLGGTGKTYVSKILCFHCGGKHMTDQCSIKDTPQAMEFQKKNGLFVSVDTLFRRP